MGRSRTPWKESPAQGPTLTSRYDIMTPTSATLTVARHAAITAAPEAAEAIDHALDIAYELGRASTRKNRPSLPQLDRLSRAQGPGPLSLMRVPLLRE
jgi:hypothetical protein